MKLYELYKPITATPFKCNTEYTEYTPCDALKPYIRCFWGTKEPVIENSNKENEPKLITPDTCMDIMFDVDFTNNKITNSFCGICDTSFLSSGQIDAGRLIFTFAIRFYAWGVPMFSEESLHNSKNSFFDVEYHFSKLKKELEPLLFDVTDMEALIPKVEAILLKIYNEKHKNELVFSAVETILHNKGAIGINELTKELHISDRQLQRLFKEYVGVSPKSLASMVRYQNLWKDIVANPKISMLDAVEKYRYSDQAHLHHEFKKYHTMNIVEAKKYALKNVGNIQEKKIEI